LLLAPLCAGAQTFRDAVLAMVRQAPDLVFPTEAKELGFFSQLGMAIYKPPGDGPFPALVIVHSCGGLRTEIQDWAKEAIARGYVAFVVDSIGPRGLKQVCIPPTPVNLNRGTRDAFQAMEHLAKFPFVDQQRIGLLGFSWGGMVALLASSRAYAEVLSPDKRFAAAVSFYPICYLAPAGNRRAIEFLRPDHDRPALVLLAEEDTEAPPADCLARLKPLQEKGAPVEWHQYAGSTHCFDCSSLLYYSKVDFLGNRVVYRYDKAVTADAIGRTFDYFALQLKPK
jgi:dienelactone hydrolase